MAGSGGCVDTGSLCPGVREWSAGASAADRVTVRIPSRPETTASSCGGTWKIIRDAIDCGVSRDVVRCEPANRDVCPNVTADLGSGQLSDRLDPTRTSGGDDDEHDPTISSCYLRQLENQLAPIDRRRPGLSGRWCGEG